MVRIDKILTEEVDRPRISASSIKDWFRCQYLWKSKYIDGFKEPPNIYFLTGTMFHWINELTDKRGSELPKTIDDLWFDQLWSMVRGQFVMFRKDFPEEEHPILDKLYSEGRETLKDLTEVLFQDGIHLLKEGGPILASEGWAKLDIPGTDWYAHGYIDRLFKNGNKWDFKTAGQKWNAFKKYQEAQAYVYPMFSLADKVYWDDGYGNIEEAPMPHPFSEEFKFFVAVKYKRRHGLDYFQTDGITTMRDIQDRQRYATLKMLGGIVREIDMHKKSDDWTCNVINGMCNLCPVRKAGLCPTQPQYISGVDEE